jgi:hypothetical protein
MTDDAAPLPLTAAEAANRLRAARDALATIGPRVVASGTWPLADDFGTGPEASWGPREVLAHVAEMLPFWLGEFERLAEADRQEGEGVPFGRLAVDELRLGVLERDRTLPLRELLDRIDAGIARWLARLPTITPGEWSARGAHPRHGDVPATWILDQMVVGHLEEHVEQLEATLSR